MRVVRSRPSPAPAPPRTLAPATALYKSGQYVGWPSTHEITRAPVPLPSRCGTRVEGVPRGTNSRTLAHRKTLGQEAFRLARLTPAVSAPHTCGRSSQDRVVLGRLAVDEACKSPPRLCDQDCELTGRQVEKLEPRCGRIAIAKPNGHLPRRAAMDWFRSW